MSELADALRTRKSETVFSLILLPAAVLFLWLFRHHGPAFLQPWFQPVPLQSPMDLTLLLAALFSALILHELGHFVAAMALRFTLLGVSAGPLQLQTLHGKWKLLFQMKRFFTGSVSAIPSSMQHWRAAIIIVVAAGPAATVATAIAAMNLQLAGHAALLWQLAFVQVSLLIFCLGLAPNGAQAGKRNDMRLLVDLALGREGAGEMELYLLLSQQVLKGVRPQDYPRDLIARLSAWRGRAESQQVFAQALCRCALDDGDVELADEWDARALRLAEQCGPQVKNAAFAFSGCFDLLYREDLEAARIKLARVDCGELFPRSFEHLTRAAQHIARGRGYRAPAEIIRAQYALPRGVPCYDFERGLLDKLHMRVLITPAERAKFQTASA